MGESPGHAAIVDTSRSPHARVRPVPVDAVTFEDSFWAPRLALNRTTIIPAQWRHCEETGRIDNFRVASGRKPGTFQGMFFNDSDVYKWVEAAAWALASGPDPELERMLGTAADEIAAAQQADGYLNTYFMGDRAKDRWTNLRDMHELYCAGHFLQAAVAHHRVTGSSQLLDVGRRLGDCIDRVFGPESAGKRHGACGHPEIETALVELFRATGERRYLDLAKFFVDIRGRGVVGGSEYHQDHVPFRDLSAMVGHAVRCGYLITGAADVVLETGDPGLRAALDRLWDNMTTRRSYVTGAVGSRYEGEAFGGDYELPDGRAYAETCAAISMMMWAWRMLALTGEATYADRMEWTLFNAILPGVSLDGAAYFYPNPLENDGTYRREPWFGCACCPPNVARVLASLPGYAYGVSAGAAWVHLYAAGRATLQIPDAGPVVIVQRTGYPWDGAVRLEVLGEGDFELRLRIPGWCEEGPAVFVNGSPADASAVPGSYAAVRRMWRRGDVVSLTLPMVPLRLEAHPHLPGHEALVALARGPVLHCVEAVDLAGEDPRDLLLPDDAPIVMRFRPDLLGGVAVLEADALTARPDLRWSGHLYRARGGGHAPARSPARLTAVPYFAWANRAPGRMRVWLKAG